MNRSDLRQRLARRFAYLSVDDVDCVISAVLGAITDSLAEGRRAEMRGFGTFSLSFRRARTVRNPLTGAQTEVPGKYMPRFKPARQLRERVAGGAKRQTRAAEGGVKTRKMETASGRCNTLQEHS